MKTQPELQSIPMPDSPCYADNREAFPALQTYASSEASAAGCHDHVLRAALLANGCRIRKEVVETH